MTGVTLVFTWQLINIQTIPELFWKIDDLKIKNLGRMTNITVVFMWQEKDEIKYWRISIEKIMHFGQVTRVTVVFTWQRVNILNTDVYPSANSQFRLCDTRYVSFPVTGSQHSQYPWMVSKDLCISTYKIKIFSRVTHVTVVFMWQKKDGIKCRCISIEKIQHFGHKTHVTLVFLWQGVNIQQSLNGFKRLMYKQNH